LLQIAQASEAFSEKTTSQLKKDGALIKMATHVSYLVVVLLKIPEGIGIKLGTRGAALLKIGQVTAHALATCGTIAERYHQAVKGN
jgi:hypothetical protein